MIKDKKQAWIIFLVASLLMVVTMMEMAAVFNQTRKQTKDSGISQLKLISGELESTISEAENLTMRLGLEAREYLDDKSALEDYIYKKKREVMEEKPEVLNVLIAGTGYTFIPDFDMPRDYVATKRVWYMGAIQNQGKPYVTSPYTDAMTGNTCYSVAVMLGDGDAVFSIDYTMENIQAHIAQMYETGSHNAIIVTDEGIIAGCSDESVLGKKLVEELPDYAGIYSLAKSKNGVASMRIRADRFYENLFATKSGNGWYLIVMESDWEMYKSSYLQLALTVLLSVMLFAIVIILYLLALKNQKKAEQALASKDEFLAGITGELREPLSKILDRSGKKNMVSMEDCHVEMAGIHEAGEKLQEMIEQIISYSNILKTEKKEHITQNKKGVNKRLKRIIIIFMCFVMLVSLYTNVSVAYKLGSELMQRQASSYEIKFSEWINTQKSILDMFASVISTNPDMLDDYEETVNFLNRITVQYPEISVTYMTNPYRTHTVYMNNGWEPEPGWHVEERQWYKDLMASESDWIISDPYYDEQTGGYCVTFAKKVYDAKTGEFLGNFGIDFFMDKLIQILGDSYSDTGYAFLVDSEGEIINHPYGSYQMSHANKINVSSLPYGKVKVDGKSIELIHDYKGVHRLLTAIRNEETNFSVYVVSDVFSVFGSVIVYGSICLVTFLVCIILVYRLLTNMTRWQDMVNRQTKESAEAAIAAGKAKSQFLAQMSHEIRTPINAVLGMNEMILRQTKDEEILEYSTNIQEAGKNLLSIINTILDFSKIEDGKMEIIPIKYDVASVIHNLVNAIIERAKAKSLAFNVQIDENLPSVLFGDDVRITQVIMNLLTNAVKYTEQGSVTLYIQEDTRENNTIYLNIGVRDTGIGIRREDMGKLFESFERLEEKRNRNIEGTGLGISIVTKLLKMMDSELLVESIYGEGSNFHFHLKQTIIDEQPIGNYEERVRRSRVQVEKQEYLFAPEAKVLVVDDNEMNLKVAKNLMKIYGFVPELVSSGQEAIDKIRDHFYHIVFLDHMMPKMDGIETLEILKKEQLIKEGMTVIALTANAVAGAREKYLAAGFDDYLSKPIEVDKLEGKLSGYLPKELVMWKQRTEKKEKIVTNRSNKKHSKDTEEKITKQTNQSEEETIEFAPSGEEEAIEFAPSGKEEAIEFAPSGDDEAIEFGFDDSTDEENVSADGIVERLQESMVDTDTGIMYCGGDTAFYVEMLEEFVHGYQEKREQLDRYREQEEYQDYQILVHALKSTSKTIGAMALSEMAKNMEDAAKNREQDYIQGNHAKLMQTYETVVETIKQTMR